MPNQPPKTTLKVAEKVKVDVTAPVLLLISTLSFAVLLGISTVYGIVGYLKVSGFYYPPEPVGCAYKVGGPCYSGVYQSEAQKRNLAFYPGSCKRLDFCEGQTAGWLWITGGAEEEPCVPYPPGTGPCPPGGPCAGPGECGDPYNICACGPQCPLGTTPCPDANNCCSNGLECCGGNNCCPNSGSYCDNGRCITPTSDQDCERRFGPRAIECGDSCCQAGTYCCQDRVCCGRSENSYENWLCRWARLSPIGPIVAAWCQQEECNPAEEFSCGRGDRRICCDKDLYDTCGGVGIGYGQTMPICLNNLNDKCPDELPNDCGTSEDGKGKVCCKATEDCLREKPDGPPKGCNARECADGMVCAGTGRFSEVRICCPANSCRLHPQGYPFCLRLLAAPTAPIALTAQRVSDTKIYLYWQDNSDNEDGFKIEANRYEVATVGANTQGYTVSNLLPGTYYCFRVRAYNSAGYSDYSNEACAQTLQKPSVLPPPGS